MRLQRSVIQVRSNARTAPRQLRCRRYVVSLQPERVHTKMRYHWMVCEAGAPDRLVSWGHAPTQGEVETAARKEITELSSGLTHGGRVASTGMPYRRNQYRITRRRQPR
jgi:hypothetical protein